MNWNNFACRALENIRQEVTPDEGMYTVGGDVQHTYRDGTVRNRTFESVAPGSTEYEAFLYTLGGCKDDLEVTEQSNSWTAAYRNVNVLNSAASKALARQEYKAGVNAPEVKKKRSLLAVWAKV